MPSLRSCFAPSRSPLGIDRCPAAARRRPNRPRTARLAPPVRASPPRRGGATLAGPPSPSAATPPYHPIMTRGFVACRRRRRRDRCTRSWTRRRAGCASSASSRSRPRAGPGSVRAGPGRAGSGRAGRSLRIHAERLRSVQGCDLHSPRARPSGT